MLTIIQSFVNKTTVLDQLDQFYQISVYLSASRLIIPALVLRQRAIKLHLIASLEAVATILSTNFGVRMDIQIKLKRKGSLIGTPNTALPRYLRTTIINVWCIV